MGSVRRPRPGSGKVTARVASAMPKAGNTAPGSRPWGAPAATKSSTAVGVDGFGAVEGDPPAGQVEVPGAKRRSARAARA